MNRQDFLEKQCVHMMYFLCVKFWLQLSEIFPILFNLKNHQICNNALWLARFLQFRVNMKSFKVYKEI